MRRDHQALLNLLLSAWVSQIEHENMILHGVVFGSELRLQHDAP